MVTYLLVVMIPITALVVGFLVLKSVQLGLRWQVEVKGEQLPTMEIHNPIAEFIQAKNEKEQIQTASQLLDEWFNGPKETR